MAFRIPVVGFIAWSGTGKTTLISSLLPILRARGIRVGVIKHTHHNVEFDTPGKDSHRLRTAGASQMLVTSARRWALYSDKEDFEDEQDIFTELERLKTDELDLVIVESFKRAPIPKIELHRESLGKPLIHPSDSHVVAVASDEPINNDGSLTLLDLNDPEQIVAYIVNQLM